MLEGLFLSGSIDYSDLLSSSLPVIEEGEVSLGCVNIGVSLSPSVKVNLKAHEAAPSKCVEECRNRQYHYALIQRRSCNCTNDNSSIQEVDVASCSVRCWSNSSLICGGEEAFSAYETGKAVSLRTILFEPKMFTREKCSLAFVILDDLSVRLSAINYISEI